MAHASQRLKSLPLSGRLLKEVHKILLSGVRGKSKNLGEFCNGAVFIGSLGETIKQARYIPSDAQYIAKLLSPKKP